MSKPLEREYEHYLEIREELAEKHDGKFVAIKGQKVLGVFDDYLHAANTVYIKHEKGTVLMQEIRADLESLTITISTPGVVAVQ